MAQLLMRRVSSLRLPDRRLRVGCVSAWRLLLAAALLSLSSAGEVAAQTREPSAAATRRFAFSRAAQQDARGFYLQPAGLCEDYPEETTTPEKIAADFDVLRRTRTKLLRFGVGWDGIETEPGVYDWRMLDEIVATAARDGVTLLPYVCYTPEWAGEGGEDTWREPPRNLERFGSFMHALASRYRGKITSWELWNEPDNRDYWRGTPKQFAVMFQSGARAVRRADPQAVVVLGGLTQPPRSAFFKSGILRHELHRWFDVLNFHAYFETWDSSPAEELPARAIAYDNALARTRTRQQTPDIWLAEFGYSSLPPRGRRVSEWVQANATHAHTPEFQAVMLLRQHFLALASERLSLTAWFRIRDLPAGDDVIGDSNNRHFGLIDVAGAPKPAFAAMQLWNGLTSQPVRRVRMEQNLPPRSEAEVHVFERADGAVIVAGWLRPAAQPKRAAEQLRADTRRELIDIHLPRSEPMGITIHRAASPGSDVPPQVRNGTVSGVAVTGDEIFVAELRPLSAE